MNLVKTPYDDVFRTLLNDCKQLILPVINEVFGENYTGEEEIISLQNEHFLNQQDGEEDKRITDSNIVIIGKNGTKQYHWECQSTADSTMLVRFFEYDVQIALDQGVLVGNTLTVTFPHAAVLFLRCNKSTPNSLRIKMITPGGEVEYDVIVMKTQLYTLDKIFEKDLLFLIPFYIFSHENKFKKYEKSEEQLESLKEDYKIIVDELEKRQQQGTISVYIKKTIIEMSRKVLEHIAENYENVRKGVTAVMGGQILEYEAKTILNNGIAIGEEHGELKRYVNDIYNLIKKRNFSKEEAMEVLEVKEKDWDKISDLVDEKLKKNSFTII